MWFPVALGIVAGTLAASLISWVVQMLLNHFLPTPKHPDTELIFKGPNNDD